jgi:uncharacterized protein (TIGR02466 family)
MGAEVLASFTVPVFRRAVPGAEDLNAELLALVLELERTTEGRSISNRGGWQSDGDLFAVDHPAIRKLQAEVLAAAAEVRALATGIDAPLTDGWIVEGWANVNRRGAWNAAHQHNRDGNQWAGVYYVHTGSASEATGGRTVFQDPTAVAAPLDPQRGAFTREIAVVPTDGEMVLFPGSLFHRVERYESDEPRVTIAFNMRHPADGVPYYEPTSFWWVNLRGPMLAGRRIKERAQRLAQR